MPARGGPASVSPVAIRSDRGCAVRTRCGYHRRHAPNLAPLAMIDAARPDPLAPGRRPRDGWLVTSVCALLVLAAVFAIALVHYQGQTLARGPDSADVLLSFFHEASRDVREEGMWAAMYTPGVLAGIPNWSNPNFHPLYPLYFNWLGGDHTVFDTLDRLNLIIKLHLAILGCGGFVLARALGVRLVPAICVGLVLPWFPAIRSAAGWPQIIAGLAWLPWIFAFQAKLYAARISGPRARRQALLATAGLALTATLLVYAQPAQNLVFAIVGSAVVWIVVGAQALIRRDRDALRRFVVSSAWLALAALIVAAATGAYLLEVLRFHQQSVRWLGEYGGQLIGDQRVPIGAMRLHALDAEDIGLLAAFEYRKGIGNAYLGFALALAAAACLLLRGQRDANMSMARGLALCAAIATLFCFAFMAPLISLIPAANKVRELTWWSCLAVVLLVPLAALGLQALQARAEAGARRGIRDPWTWALVAAFALALLATMRMATPWRIEAGLALVVGFAALAWSLFARGRGRNAHDIACVVVLVCAVWMPFRHNIVFPREDATLFLPDRVEARAEAARLAALLPDEAVYRIALSPELTDASLLTQAYANLGFRAIRGGISPINHAKFQLLHFPNPAVSALYGVKYALLPSAAAQPGDRRLDAHLSLRTHAGALPRLFFIGGGLRVVDDPVAALRALTDADPVHAFVARDDLPAGFGVDAYATGAPTLAMPNVAENRRTHLRATLDNHRPGLLVLNEDPEARWRARIDGKPVAGFRVNGFQTAFAIADAGRHTVEIERPGRLFGSRP